ncbi:MAG: hypothetical protein H6558_04465 [Lewinellaceae bacterium]|nr:hypothetical protein [Lewinellaceae bacterium]
MENRQIHVVSLEHADPRVAANIKMYTIWDRIINESGSSFSMTSILPRT